MAFPKNKRRKVHVNGEEWTWCKAISKTMIQEPNGTKHELHDQHWYDTGAWIDDEDAQNALTPDMVKDYIEQNLI